MSRVQTVAGLAVCLGAMALPVKAEEVFLCEDGRLVYASMETLEGLKRTDPCVARYFGLDVTAKPPAPAASKPALLRGSADLPDAAGDAGAANDGPQSSVPSRLRGAERHAARADKPAMSGTASAVPAKAASLPAAQGNAATASAATPAVSANNGYREVHILNAGDGAGAVYHHDR